METMIKVNQRVRASMSVQGMVANRVYEVTDVNAKRTPFGTFVQYQLDNNLWVQNLPQLINWVK